MIARWLHRSALGFMLIGAVIGALAGVAVAIPIAAFSAIASSPGAAGGDGGSTIPTGLVPSVLTALVVGGAAVGAMKMLIRSLVERVSKLERTDEVHEGAIAKIREDRQGCVAASRLAFVSKDTFGKVAGELREGQRGTDERIEAVHEKINAVARDVAEMRGRLAGREESGT